MKFRPAFSLSDVMVTILSLMLAGWCAYFAGSKIYNLQSMENPPADLGLNFPKPKRKPTIAPRAVLVDPLITGSIDPFRSGAATPAEPAQPYRSDSPVLGYRLLAVIDGLAFVEVTTATGRNIAPFGRGSLLPGAGRIRNIEKINGRWQLAAGSITLAAERQ